MRVLVCRTDRIGDVVLSTPVLRALRQNRPDAQITVLARPVVHPLLRGLDAVDELLPFEPSRHRGRAGVTLLARTLRARRFDAAIVLFSEPAVAWAVWLARIPVRIGPRSKPHSFLCYNRGVRQRRSLVEKHEAEYNLELLQPLGLSVPPRTFFPEIDVPGHVRIQAGAWLAERGWAAAGRRVALHPGMGGSALNWPAARYVELARALRSDGCRLLITSGPLDRDVVPGIRANLGLTGVDYHQGEGDDVAMLAALYERMSLVIAPSTGPLHLAAAVGTPVLGFFPNLRVQSPARWGPYTDEPDRAAVLVPDVDCETDPACMSSIATATALECARHLLQQLPAPF